MRARGLKHSYALHPWVSDKSRPVRARGLKHDGAGEITVTLLSRPVRARGLKPAVIYDIEDVLGRAPCGRVD